MELPPELIDELISHADLLTALNLASTCWQYESRRHSLYPRLLPFVYNNRDLSVDFARALSRKHELGIRYMMKYVDYNTGLLLALKYNHELAVSYFKTIFLHSKSIPNVLRVEYYIHKFCLEHKYTLIYYEYVGDSPTQQQLADATEHNNTIAAYAYYGMVASGRRDLAGKFKEEYAKVTHFAFAKALRYGDIQIDDDVRDDIEWLNDYKIYRIAKEFIKGHKNEHLGYCLRLISTPNPKYPKPHRRDKLNYKDGELSPYQRYKYKCLYKVAAKYGNAAALEILEQENFPRFIVAEEKIGDGFKPGDDIWEFIMLRYEKRSTVTFKEFEYLLQFAGDNREQLITDMTMFWYTQEIGKRYDMFNMLHAYEDVLEDVKELKYFWRDYDMVEYGRIGWERDKSVKIW